MKHSPPQIIMLKDNSLTGSIICGQLLDTMSCSPTMSVTLIKCYINYSNNLNYAVPTASLIRKLCSFAITYPIYRRGDRILLVWLISYQNKYSFLFVYAIDILLYWFVFWSNIIYMYITKKIYPFLSSRK